MILGLDVGSLTVSAVLADRDGSVWRTYYEEHGGHPRACLSRILQSLPPAEIEAVAAGAGTPRFVRTDNRYNETVATIRAGRSLHPEARSLLSVGAERFFLALFDEDGSYRGVRGNTSCAAGTGSFLDEQARRLGLEDGAELSSRARAATGPSPAIASRCSVFARTDLIHAQQEGYDIESICDGLCHGLARNLVDTLTDGGTVPGPVLFAGGVSRNATVVDYVGSLLRRRVIADELGSVYVALGAVLEHTDRIEGNHEPTPSGPVAPEALLDEEQPARTYHFPELPVEPPPENTDSPRHEDVRVPGAEDNPVETDIYSDLPQSVSAYLGIDIGSTSTKAALLQPDGEVLAAFYTRTAGRPLDACRSLFRAVREVERRENVHIGILAVGTTGSGRSFVGRVIGADLILDEITAHARAAVTLDPEVDTIIEIGGQDAKFTRLREGHVVFSHMNTVCAAGTGSFIEEQAAKLGVPLTEYGRRVKGAASPLVSDRCTVFMERDINHYQNQEYDTAEILAAVVHSVRENYLQKVAGAGNIGERICFQGATAKNHALVAAFRQKLQRPIFVSRYCHVTGAMGVALELAEGHRGSTAFRGLDLYKEEIPVRTERCNLCANRCHLRVAEVAGESVAYGFLCGRDYRTDHYVPPAGRGVDLLGLRRRVERDAAAAAEVQTDAAGRADRGTIGLPRALHLTADLPFWRTFFRHLGVEVVENDTTEDALARGKALERAEFCAPMANLHGRVAELADTVDYVFCPAYMGPADAQGYCYYTQFAGPVLESGVFEGAESRLITPALGPVGPTERIRNGRLDLSRREAAELAASLDPVAPGISAEEVREAYAASRDYVSIMRAMLRSQFEKRRVPPEEDITVILTGRPYTILDPAMNKGIPEVMSRQGVAAFYHDMVPEYQGEEYATLIGETAWSYARDILETARRCAFTEGLYPVLVTSFKCSPDSMIIDFFTRIMERHGKPYLILQVDEHDSSVGYETRIEAGIRAFRNHHRERRRLAEEPGMISSTEENHDTDPARTTTRIGDRTLLLPTWDPVTAPFLAANLVRHGVDARVLPETPEAIRRSTRLNTGQCIPLSVIAQETLEAIRTYELDPARTALWMPESRWPCNIAMYPQFLKQQLSREGAGEVAIFAGDFSYVDISPQATLGAYFAYLFGGLLRRIGCMIRPYEMLPGCTDRAISEGVTLLEEAFLGRARRNERLDQALALLDAVPRAGDRKPKVAVFGDLYVRDNEVFNQGLIRTIEEAGGEVVTTPYSDYAKIIAAAHFKRLIRHGKYADWALYRTLLSVIELVERRYYERVEKWVGPRTSSRETELQRKLETFGLHIEHSGESFDNILKIYRLLEEHPDIALFVQASPAFCCPSLVTEAMSEKIRAVTGVPVVPITYDGTGTPKNDMLVPYLRFAAARSSRAVSS